MGDARTQRIVALPVLARRASPVSTPVPRTSRGRERDSEGSGGRPIYYHLRPPPPPSVDRPCRRRASPHKCRTPRLPRPVKGRGSRRTSQGGGRGYEGLQSSRFRPKPGQHNKEGGWGPRRRWGKFWGNLWGSNKHLTAGIKFEKRSTYLPILPRVGPLPIYLRLKRRSFETKPRRHSPDFNLSSFLATPAAFP